METNEKNETIGKGMKIKEFIYNNRLNALLTEMINLDHKLKVDDPSLKEDIGYKQSRYHFNPMTTKMSFNLGVIAFSLVLSSSMLMAFFIYYLVNYGFNKSIVISCILLVFFISSLSVFLGYLFLGRGDIRGIYIHRTLYQITLVMGILLLISNPTDSFLHMLCYLLMIFISLLIKFIMNNPLFFDSIIKMKYFKITHVLLNEDMKEIISMNKKQAKTYAKELKSQKRRYIREIKKSKK
ncbi:hypothetical protein Xbed_01309 [Xenorhabdus beddingii]|uniref:Uncharacterized protein n=1 Tax=Xenorhabdus beddingii TaxID=40578 RepID=A0A1Y2SND3_9GAMM|nr:hypothetical protein [Xenorhabdus beddingii]OTA20505.1 hypothetical protein Xbed_01309 [Xenorhabdus beddingii]